jgi:hypothetical protein
MPARRAHALLEAGLAAALAAALAATLSGCGDGSGTPDPGPPADVTPPALVAFTPPPGQAAKASFQVFVTFDEPVVVQQAWFRSDLEEHAITAAMGASGREVVVDLPLVDSFGTRFRLDVADGAGNPASVWVGDWYAQPIYLEFLEPSLLQPCSGTVTLRVNWAGPLLLPVSVDEAALGVLGEVTTLDLDTTKLADGWHTFVFHAPGYQRTLMPFQVDNTP